MSRRDRELENRLPPSESAAGDVLGATCNTSVCESLWIYLRRHLRALVCLDVKGQGRLDLAAEQ